MPFCLAISPPGTHAQRPRDPFPYPLHASQHPRACSIFSVLNALCIAFVARFAASHLQRHLSPFPHPSQGRAVIATNLTTSCSIFLCPCLWLGLCVAPSPPAVSARYHNECRTTPKHRTVSAGQLVIADRRRSHALAGMYCGCWRFSLSDVSPPTSPRASLCSSPVISRRAH